ncbi:ABC transporter ATP-binding protein [Maledivibacter halophilus]|uniref:ABC-2 type transport system ATP-binding protein n=1 Tax=Maledivibacter halophilus TaxID=36842 RepID=A0A1T5KPD6_9FIRM|nr:ABC transporter ATP-binding protein [Maledivibacter halophilus]SKC65491.1 ABC-2 type transport system ATP-binding protein [Maledivibacter halophilus]
MENILKVEELTKKYFNKVALDKVSISFEQGKIYGLLGPNGSGKTTLMKVIAGLHKQTSGQVFVNGNPISYKTKKDVAFMPTEDFLYPWMKAKTLGKYFSDMYKDFNRAKFINLIEKLEISKENKVSELSTGLKGRLKVALAIARDASIYMFDEPLNGLDPISREKVMNLISEAFNENKVIIISSHLVSELETYLDEVVFLKNGIIELKGDAESMREENGKSIEALYKEVY